MDLLCLPFKIVFKCFRFILNNKLSICEAAINDQVRTSDEGGL